MWEFIVYTVLVLAPIGAVIGVVVFVRDFIEAVRYSRAMRQFWARNRRRYR